MLNHADDSALIALNHIELVPQRDCVILHISKSCYIELVKVSQGFNSIEKYLTGVFPVFYSILLCNVISSRHNQHNTDSL